MKKIAIVGCGPRGLASLENLMASLAKYTSQPEVSGLIFEPEKYPGAGQVWKLDQVDSNWSNISDRALKNLEGREKIDFESFTIPKFPSYIQWMDEKYNHKLSEEVDQFPPRNIMGRYLNERFNSIYKVLETQKLYTLIKTEVKEIRTETNSLLLVDDTGKTYECDECLLSIGHQSTYDDDQIKKWKKHCENTPNILIDNPYSKDLQTKVASHHKVAIRGFGLAMIDVVRMLTVEKGASFTTNEKGDKLTYIPSDNSVGKIAAFSLDGLPMVPKPLGNNVDQFFEATDAQIQGFRDTINKSLTDHKKTKDHTFLLKAFSEIAAAIFLNHPLVSTKSDEQDIRNIIESWLDDMSFEHSLILNTKLPIVDYMMKTVAMARGTEAPSLDFCIGQVWRHLQPTMYALFSHCMLDEEVIEKIVTLDESTKRYSYGPPVKSIEQLIALANEGVLELRYARDPDIKCVENGWELSEAKNKDTYNVMIDSVLDAPKLVAIDSGLIVNLKNSDLLSPVTSNLGVDTRKDGVVILSKKNENVFLTMLGRNCKGSVLGVDAILECFGSRIEDWAEGVADRLQ
ncbi:FAD/NAD(P)-binding protein [Ulvibacter antarcticus]|uniref:FAD-NAD(P)-binding protein n=1 Tax=Ulvibacter antarcticus TaxID=442714 RepID=A0A3L9Z3H4_9FLAO|nr:FAD/NAD(P)-binding protein [Ulvibacter antarcticus]RMA66547.1 FAD-NAD(P)-binding protein [Ulvibacter antarcticus]